MDNFYIAEKMMEWKAKEMEQFFSMTIDEEKETILSRLFNLFKFKKKKSVCCCCC